MIKANGCKIDSLSILNIEVELLGGDIASLIAKAVLTSDSGMVPHAQAIKSDGWSKETSEALQKLIEFMEKDMAKDHFSDADQNDRKETGMSFIGQEIDTPQI